MCLQIRLIVELLFCGILFGPTQAWLAYGEGTQFQKVVWYHFPKTGKVGQSSMKNEHRESPPPSPLHISLSIKVGRQ